MSIVHLTDPNLQPRYNIYVNKVNAASINPESVSGLDIYLAENGDDNNSGLDADKPVATLSKALEIYRSSGFNLTCTITVFGSVNIDEADVISFSSTNGGRQLSGIVVKGTVKHIIEGFTVGAVTASPPAGITIVDIGSVVDTDTINGNFAVFTSGDLKDNVYVIGDAGISDVKELALMTSDVPQVGDTFNVYRNDAVFVSTSDREMVFSIPVEFKNLDFQCEDELKFVGQTIGLSGCKFTQPVSANTNYYFENISVNLTDVGNSFIAEGDLLITISNSNLSLENSYLYSLSITSKFSKISFTRDMMQTCNQNLTDNSYASYTNIYVQGGVQQGISCVSSKLKLEDCDISDCEGSGVELIDSNLSCIGTNTSSNANSDYGVALIHNSCARVTSTTTQLTGGSAEVSIGVLIGSTWADAQAGGAITQCDWLTSPFTAESRFCYVSFI